MVGVSALWHVDVFPERNDLFRKRPIRVLESLQALFAFCGQDAAEDIRSLATRCRIQTCLVGIQLADEVDFPIVHPCLAPVDQVVVVLFK